MRRSATALYMPRPTAQAVMTQAAVAALTQAAQMPQELLRLIQD